ncbi:hypothetical protein M011DRAFT_469008 [Sporormia fimetaria CBS 119925]|uniref:BRCT domain-containing protein n=1 Tax=Sporormia fimetaria CBS 119925 TaxID=1340428 RepID=A0A6A6V653_9PLEO|nr:hypothetical protein M011DRAFT_469008 [Sporormia fimetaria CBS 119925]
MAEDYSQLKDEVYDDPEKLSQLLQQRAGNHNSFRFTSTTEGTHASFTPFTAAAPHPILPPPPTPRRVPATTRHVKPTLSTHHSAPLSTAPVEEKAATDRMYHSFAGDNVAGDTQPDSQIYKNIALLKANTGNKLQRGISVLDMVGEEPNVVDSQESDMPSPTILHDESQQQSNPPLTSPLKFQTPLMAGRKRKDQGQVLSSAAKTTPGTELSAAAFIQPTVGSTVTKALSLTQVFNGTQAPTSPVAHGLDGNAASPPPSPSYAAAQRSSPPQAISSPSAPFRAGARSSSEPRAEYITMKESQERRLLEEEDKITAPLEQDSWEEAAALSRQIAQRKAREQREREAAAAFTKVTAPSISRRGRRRGGASSISRDDKSRGSSHGPALTEHASSVDHPGPENENARRDDEESGDEAVAASRPNPSSRTGTGDKVQVPRTSSHPQGSLQTHPAPETPLPTPIEQPQAQPQVRRTNSQPLNKARKAVDSFTVMDSQPEDNDSGSMPRPKILLPSSPSTNQYSINQTTIGGKTGFTSQVISSSAPPMPPQTSSPDIVDAEMAVEQGDDDTDNEEEERVPSSPPPVRVVEGDDDEDDIVYDEHEYEEHRSADDNDDHDREASASPERGDFIAESVPVAEEDVVMGEADGACMHNAPEEPEVDDQERPETAKDWEPREQPAADDEMVRSSHLEEQSHDTGYAIFTRPPFLRHSTVPESDLMEDTQPSTFAQANTGTDNYDTAKSRASRSVSPHQDLSAGSRSLQTAPEHQTHNSGTTDELGNNANTAVANNNRPVIEDNNINPPQSDDRNPRSPLQDTHAHHISPKRSPLKRDQTNFRSLSDIANQPETQLSVDINNLEIPTLDFTDELNDDFMSPTRQSPKKRKITYTSKHKQLRSPAKSTARVVSTIEETPGSSVLSEGAMANTSSSGMEPQVHTAENEENAPHAVTSPPLAIKDLTTPGSRKPTKTQKKGALKRVNKNMLTTPVSAAKTIRAKDIYDDLPAAAHENTDEVAVAVPEVAKADRTHEVEVVSSVQDSTEVQVPEFTVSVANDRGEEPTGDVVAASRVFAFWPGQGQGYYPATCMGSAGAGKVEVRYDEGSEHTLDLPQVKSLELRIGDQVKVDQKGMKKHLYTVVGFKDKIDGNIAEEYPLVDCYGYQTVVLEAKQRASLPATAAAEPPRTVSAPITKIYFTAQLLPKFQDRPFQSIPPARSPSVASTRVATPGAATSFVDSPAASRRVKGSSLLKETFRASSAFSSFQGPAGDIFANMAFAISLQNDTSEQTAKQSIQRAIASQGGNIVNEFQDLFDDIEVWAADKALEHPIRSTPSAGIALRPGNQELGFVALITDMHSRKIKYMQALALNIPCLHHRWVSDSIAAGRALPFRKYLLPAGVSKFLDPYGVVRSRDMPSYDPANASFLNMVEQRPTLLKDQSVLLVIRNTKKDADRKRPYMLLTVAQNPAILGHCYELSDARELVGKGDWDWVIVHGGAVTRVPDFKEAEAVVFGTGSGAAEQGTARKNRKRKRKREESEESEALSGELSLVRYGEVNGKRVRLTCDEFLIQSLILGELAE